MIRRLIPPLLLTLSITFVSLAAISGGDARHISLVSSAPANDTVLSQSPAEIRLWFSGVPRASATSIRLLASSGEPVSTVHVMPAAPDPQDGRMQFAQIHGTLGSGRYRVAWATVAQDGTEAEGEIAFSVRTR